jgi:hypothetical protein
MQNRDQPYPVCRDFVQGRCMREHCKFRHELLSKDRDMSQRTDEMGRVGGHPRSFKNKEKYNKHKTRDRKPRNTECFLPMTKPVDMRLVLDLGSSKLTTFLTTRDVLLVPNLFSDVPKGYIHEALMNEIESCGVSEDDLLKLWHGNDKVDGTHLIVNDRTPWKDKCPTFAFVVNQIKDFFDMDIQATRLNIYKDTSHWKPFHHDSAYVNPEKAKVQNFTVAVSFGCTRDAAFEHATTKTVLSLPQGDGMVYCFTNDTNAIWRHGILQDMPVREEGRISVICWGKINNIQEL